MRTEARSPDGYSDEELARREARDAEVRRLQEAGLCYQCHDQQVGGELLGRDTVIAARKPQRSLSLSKGKVTSGLALRQAQGTSTWSPLAPATLDQLVDPRRPLRDAAELTAAVREQLGEGWTEWSA